MVAGIQVKARTQDIVRRIVQDTDAFRDENVVDAIAATENSAFLTKLIKPKLFIRASPYFSLEGLRSQASNRTNAILTHSSRGTNEKWLSNENTADPATTAHAAIQRSFCGIGVPLAFNTLNTLA